MSDPPSLSYQAIATVQGQVELGEPHPTLTIDDAVFAAFVSPGIRKKLLPGTVQTFRVYPRLWRSQLTFDIRRVVDGPALPVILNGCWELSRDVPFFIIYRNELLHPGDRKLQTLVPSKLSFSCVMASRSGSSPFA